MDNSTLLERKTLPVVCTSSSCLPLFDFLEARALGEGLIEISLVRRKHSGPVRTREDLKAEASGSFM